MYPMGITHIEIVRKYKICEHFKRYDVNIIIYYIVSPSKRYNYVADNVIGFHRLINCSLVSDVQGIDLRIAPQQRQSPGPS